MTASKLKPNHVGHHYLVAHPVTSEFPDWDYDIEHPKTCPKQNFEGYYDYSCPEAYYIAEWGVESLLDEIKAPDRYAFEYWHSHTPSSVYGPEEYDGGLQLIDEADTQGNNAVKPLTNKGDTK